MANLNDLSNLFNIPENVEEMSVSTPKQKVDENLYTINFRKENIPQGNAYKARIRFLPNINPMESIIAKYNYWLVDANNENGFYVDCPSSIGEKSPIADLFFKFKKSTNPVELKYAEQLKRNRQFFSLVQILQDAQHPELEGRVMVFRYGTKIREKIKQEGEDKEYGSNPFDLMSGREFKIEVKMVGGYQNYDGCQFVGGRTPVTVNGKKLVAGDAKTLRTLYENAPDLNEYKFKPWTAEITQRVNDNLKTYTKGFTPTAIESALQQETEPDEVNSPIPTTSFNTDDGDDFLDGINL